MMAALARSNCEQTFQFSAGQRTVRVSVIMSNVVLTLYCMNYFTI